MQELLFITPDELAKTTILGGNVDRDKYTFSILNVQKTVIERLLGTELYDKIINDIENQTLTGLYEELYNNYVKPITKYESCAEYIEVSGFILDNGGLYKHTANNAETATFDETYRISQKYHALSQVYVQRFEKWICKNHLPEYKCHQDEVNASKIKNTSGWYL
tara:strand:+ start:1445 stop:1936 length:492 start_codon:yes stop_codon:yes gene_type:complete